MSLFDQIDCHGHTDVGIRRSHNQDAFSIQKAVDRDQWHRVGHIFLVADGMGGHAVGEKASAKAVRDIPLIYAKHVKDGVPNALRRAFQETNSAIHAIGQENQEFRGLGTTGTGLFLRPEGAWVAHVGDSRVYRIRNGQIEQLSFDHSYVWEMARRLNVPPEELSDVKKNVIIRSLGPDAMVEVDVEGPYPVENGDIFLICSDGLSNQVSPEEMGTVATALPPTEACKFLTELANLKGGPDNITTIIVRIGYLEPSTVSSALPRPNPIKRLALSAGKAWFRRVPWSLNVLIVGFLFALLYVWLRAGGTGSVMLLVITMITILIGLVGLFIQFRKPRPLDDGDNEIRTKPNIYRQHESKIEPEMLEKLQKMGSQLHDLLQTNKTPSIDWNSFRSLRDAAEKYKQEGDLLASFRDICRALLCLARPYNQSRAKGDGFNPKFKGPFDV